MNITEIAAENSQAPDVAKIHAELVLFVKYNESVGESSTNTTVTADVKINARISIDLENALNSPSSCASSAMNLVAADCSPKVATAVATPVTSTNAV
jgi:hypothetical protein